MKTFVAAGAGYLRQSLVLLADAICQYRQGKPEFYSIAAIQLRLLFCDTTRRHNRVEDISLVRRVFPHFSLPIPKFDDKGHPLNESFLELDDWLNHKVEILPGMVMPIRDLVREVCDRDGGVHVDLRWQVEKEKRLAMRAWIIRLAECVLPVLKASLPG